jgi:hypothetical protein
MTDWTAADLPSFAGRTVIITGANSGLGAVTARELAGRGTDADFGARQTLFAASQDLPGDTFVGPRFGYLGRTQPIGRSRRAQDTSTAGALWDLSEQLTGTKSPLL